MVFKFLLAFYLLGISLFASQKDSKIFAEYIARPYFDLDIDSIKKISTAFLKQHKNIKAFYIEEDKNKFLSAYKKNNEIIFVKLLPKEYLNLNKKSSSINYLGKNIGKVTIFYEEITSNSNTWKGINDTKLYLKLTNHEKIYLSNKKIITICVDPNWMPYEKIENGKYIGIGSDYINLFEQKLNLKFKLIETKSWQESKIKARNRECEVLPLSSNSEKRREFMNVTKPYLIEPLVLATKINSKFVTSIEELKDKKIGITNGYSISTSLKKKYPYLQIVNTKNVIDGLEKVNQGELFGQIDAISTLNYYIQDSFWNKIKISGKLDEKYELGIASNKDDNFLHKILSKVIQNISKEEHRQIYYKWNVKEKIIEKTNYTLLLEVFLILLSIIILIMFWNNKLKKAVNNKTQELKQLNDSLEQKVSDEIEKNRQNEINLLEQAKMAQMGEMIGNIAHQWRQPLSAISSYSSSLKLLSQLDNLSRKEIEDTADKISEKTQYLSNTIETFRNFLAESKEEQELILQDVINISIDIISASLKDHNIKLIKNINDKESFKIKMMKGELEQVLINIMNNAKDILLEKKNSNPYIKIELTKQAYKYIISIEDNGGGIPEKIITKIFDPYFTTKHKTQGTGLGLHMSYRIITDSINGKIYVKNIKNGAKFFIELPIE